MLLTPSTKSPYSLTTSRCCLDAVLWRLLRANWRNFLTIPLNHFTGDSFIIIQDAADLSNWLQQGLKCTHQSRLYQLCCPVSIAQCGETEEDFKQLIFCGEQWLARVAKRMLIICFYKCLECLVNRKTNNKI